MSLHLQACSSLRDYGRLWCCGFLSLGLLGSAALEDTVVEFVSFCFFLSLGCPPGSTFCGLGWPPVPCWALPTWAYPPVFGSFPLWLGLFAGRPASSSPRPSGLNPVGFLFPAFLIFAFRLWLCARFAAL